MSGFRMSGWLGRAGILGVLALGAVTAFADDSVTDGRTPPSIEPGSPDRSFVLSGFETVDLYSGKVNFRLPLHTVGGRGSAGFTMVLPIQRNWRMVHHQLPNGADVYRAVTPTLPDIPYWGNAAASRYSPGHMAGRQTYNPDTSTPTYECLNLKGRVVGASTITRLTWTSADGTEQEFRDLSTGGQLLGHSVDPCTISLAQRATSGPNRGTVFVASDGSGSTFVANSPIVDSLDPATVGGSFPVAGVLLLADGTRYELDSNGNVASMRDRNGNLITFGGDPQQAFTLAVTDSMGRTTNVTKADFGSAIPSDIITFPGIGGTRSIVVKYAQLGSALISGQSLQTYRCLFPELDQSSVSQFNPWVVSSVVLADQVSSYSFQYNSYGELVRVVLPTGGAIVYTYPTFSGSCPASGSGISGVSNLDLNIYRHVQSRQVLPDGATTEQQTNYSYSFFELGQSGIDPNHPTWKTMTALVQHQISGSSASPGSQEMHYFWGNSTEPPVNSLDNPLLYAPWYESREYQTTARNASGNVLRQQVTSWGQRPCPAVDAHDAPCWFGDPTADTAPVRDTRMTGVATTVDFGLASQLTSSVAYQYDRYNNKIQTDEYNYDGTDKRTTTANFVTTLNGTDYANVVLNTDGSLTRTSTMHVRRLPLTTSVTGPAGLEASTTNEYDNYTSDSKHSALQTYPETLSGWDTTTTNFRGNVTGVLRSYLQGSRTIATYRQYDQVGNVVVTLDEIGNATRIAYDPVYFRALPTSVQNALGQTTITGFDVDTSLPIFQTDPNGNVTAYGYESGSQPDPFNRLTSVVVAGGASSTLYSYPSLKQVTATRDQTSAACPQSPTSLVSDIFYDGLGRQIQTVLHDAAGNITTEKVYDFLGRPYSASNPHRSSDTVNLTLSTFDALGRISQVKTSSDSSVVYSGYLGNAAFVVDQAGKWRETQTDALGRVTSVIEDPTVAANSPQNPFSSLGLANASGANLTTSYLYDARDDLTSVTQGLETRQFVYDSLKRLTSATNPESGATTYQYYDTGTLQQKQSGASVTTSFTYDALNRITSKSYSGDGGITPAVNYCYDGVRTTTGPCSTAPNGGLNVIGRLTLVTSSAATRQYTAYDALGRVLRIGSSKMSPWSHWMGQMKM